MTDKTRKSSAQQSRRQNSRREVTNRNHHQRTNPMVAAALSDAWVNLDPRSCSLRRAWWHPHQNECILLQVLRSRVIISPAREDPRSLGLLPTGWSSGQSRREQTDIYIRVWLSPCFPLSPALIPGTIASAELTVPGQALAALQKLGRPVLTWLILDPLRLATNVGFR